MDEATPADEPTYAEPSHEGRGAHTPLVLVAGAVLATVVVVVAFIALRGGDTGGVATETTSRAGGETAALVPSEGLLDQWDVRETSEGPLSEEVGEVLVVVPAGSSHAERQRGVLVERLPFDTRGANPSVTVGNLSGTFSERDENGLALLAVGDGRRTIELRAAPGTPIDTLRGLAGHVGLDAPVDAIEPGPEWEVLVTSAVIAEGRGRDLVLGARDSMASVSLSTWTEVDPAVMQLIDLPFLSSPVEVRGHDGLEVSAWGGSTALLWVEAPRVVVWLLLRDDRGTLEQAMEIAEGLVSVDAAGWDSFVTTHQVERPEDTLPPPSSTSIPEEREDADRNADRGDDHTVMGELADGRDFLVGEVGRQGVCVHIEWVERGCRLWDTLLVPQFVSEAGDDGTERVVLAYGYVAGDADVVVATFADETRQPTLNTRSLWAISIPPGHTLVRVEHLRVEPGAAPEVVATAELVDGSWTMDQAGPAG